MTLETRSKAIKDLEAILSNLAYKDFKQANPKPRMSRNGWRIHKAYNLSEETQKALKMLYRATKRDVTAEDEEAIKAFLLPYRMFKPEYLINIDPRLR